VVEYGAVEISLIEGGLVQSCLNDDGPVEIGACEVGLAQISFGEIGAPSMPPQVSALKRESCKLCGAEVYTGERLRRRLHRSGDLPNEPAVLKQLSLISQVAGQVILSRCDFGRQCVLPRLQPCVPPAGVKKNRNTHHDTDDGVLARSRLCARHHPATTPRRVVIADPVNPAGRMLLLDAIRRFWP
jgi:hypothetical protein